MKAERSDNDKLGDNVYNRVNNNVTSGDEE